MSTNDPQDDEVIAEGQSAEGEGLFDERITSYPWLAGVLAGTWTFVAGYVLMGLVIVGSGGVEGSLVDNFTRILEDVGVTFYNAHNVVLNVEVVADIVNPSDLESQTIDTLSGGTRLPKIVYYAVPVVALAGASGLLAWRTLPDDATIGEAVLPATAMTAGYTAFAVLGTFVLRPSRADPSGLVVAVLVPNLSQTVVFALLYGLLVSFLATVLVVAYRNREDLRRRTGR